MYNISNGGVVRKLSVLYEALWLDFSSHPAYLGKSFQTLIEIVPRQGKGFKIRFFLQILL